MEKSDILEVDYDEFEKTVTELTKLKNRFEDKKKELINTNSKLLDEKKWKGKSRDKYKEISDEQEKRFEELKDKFEEFTINLQTILDGYIDTEAKNSNEINGEGQ